MIPNVFLHPFLRFVWFHMCDWIIETQIEFNEFSFWLFGLSLEHFSPSTENYFGKEKAIFHVCYRKKIPSISDFSFWLFETNKPNQPATGWIKRHALISHTRKKLFNWRPNYSFFFFSVSLGGGDLHLKIATKKTSFFLLVFFLLLLVCALSRVVLALHSSFTLIWSCPFFFPHL